ncbi:MAG TPA: hypothetical protein VL947_13395 [Cytophagales bacterium]|nr:hypothetical protein [Cytophagales bacterium]
MKSIFAVVVASLYGLSVRLIFGFLNNVLGIMSVTFLMLVPIFIGFLNIRLMPVKSAIAAFFIPWITSTLLLVITLLFNIEGIICWLMIFPVFAIFAGIGGIIAYHMQKRKDHKSKYRDTLDISFAVLLPLLLGYIEGERTLSPEVYTLKEEVVIPASSKKVWHTLTHLSEVGTQEKHTPLSTFMGFPKHLKTMMDTAAVGQRRMAYYERGLFFEETITKLEHERLLVLDIHTDPNKIPPTIMDEHIVIGGKHLDILEDTYELKKMPDGNTHLTLSSKFYINTPLNWYAGIWAKLLMSDLLSGELKLIQKRAIE